MKEMQHKSWISRILGGKLTNGEAFFCCILLFLLFFWPIALLAAIFSFDAPTVPFWLEVARRVFAATILLYPFYIVPLIIIASRVSKKLAKPYLFYLIAGLPLISTLFCILISSSPLAERRPEGSDFFSYEMIGSDWQSQYAKDKNHVYYAFEEIKGADVATFHLIGKESGYSVDKNHVYYQGKIVKGSNPTTFRFLKENMGCDDKDYYASGVAFHVSDYQSFRSGDRNWAVDKNYVYYVDYRADEHHIDTIPVGDYQSFKELNEVYAKDSRHVYFKAKIVSGADAISFHVFSEYETFGQDKNRVYYEDKATDVKDYKLLYRWKECLYR
jgi:hypothetical protein